MLVRRTLYFALLSVTCAAVAVAQDSIPPKPATTTATADLGFVSATGNTELTTLNVGEKVIHTDGRFIISQLGVYVLGETKKVKSAEDLRTALRMDVSWTQTLGGFVGVAYERNTYAGYVGRLDEIAGMLVRAIVQPEDSLSLDLGGVLTQQNNVDGTSTRTPSARGAMNYKHSFSKTSYFQQLAEYLPDLQNHGQYRLNTESSVVAPISSHVGVKVSYAFRFDSNPPATFGSTDRVLTTGVQISY